MHIYLKIDMYYYYYQKDVLVNVTISKIDYHHRVYYHNKYNQEIYVDMQISLPLKQNN